MKLILGGINGEYLRDITENAKDATEEVLAAVAYASEASLLFDWCRIREIPLRYYGRLDDSVAVTIAILKQFLEAKSPDFVCKLVRHHHAKVIWWRGLGLYIGSANLSRKAWYNNVEAGCFFQEEEMTADMTGDIQEMFATLESNSTPLTEEVLRAMSIRDRELTASNPSAASFWASPSFVDWPGLVHTGKKNAQDKRRQKFLEEWHSTLQELRDIGAIISRAENRPSWVVDGVPIGAQADQFLHAHYYQRAMENGKAMYASHYQTNRARRKEAVAETISWWRKLVSAPRDEDVMLNQTAPRLRSLLSQETITSMTYDQFREVCMHVHAIVDYSRRVSNDAVSLAGGKAYSIPQKVDALSNRIWNVEASAGAKVKGLLSYILYGGSNESLPERLWQGVADARWKIPGLGISALGELTGWALPERFPPRNGRTSKALRSLGRRRRRLPPETLATISKGMCFSMYRLANP